MSEPQDPLILGLALHSQGQFPEALQQFYAARELEPARSEAVLGLAATLCDLGGYDEAERLFRELTPLGTSPETKPELILRQLAERHFTLAKDYEGAGLPLGACHEYQKALGLQPHWSEAQLALARAYLNTEQLAQAEKEFESLPDSAERRIGWGLLHFKKGERSKARLQWEKACQLAPENTVAKAFLEIASQWPLDPPPASNPLT